MNPVLAKHVRDHVPELKTQRQLEIAVLAVELLVDLIRASLRGDDSALAKDQERLTKILDVLRESPLRVEQAKEIPEDQRSEALKDFVTPLRSEAPGVVDEILRELSALTSQKELSEWYRENRARIEQLSDNRNQVFDTIRTRKEELC